MFKLKKEAQSARKTLGPVEDTIFSSEYFLALELVVGDKGFLIVTNRQDLIESLHTTFTASGQESGILALRLPDGCFAKILGAAGDPLTLSVKDISEDVADDLWYVINVGFKSVMHLQSDVEKFFFQYHAMIVEMIRMGKETEAFANENLVQGHCWN